MKIAMQATTVKGIILVWYPTLQLLSIVLNNLWLVLPNSRAHDDKQKRHHHALLPVSDDYVLERTVV